MNRPSRRWFIGGAGAAVIVACAGLGAWPTALRAARRPLVCLDPRLFSVVAAAADRLCPATADSPSAWDLEVPEDVDAALAAMDPRTAGDVANALRLLEFGLLGAVDGRILPFTRCDPSTQDRVLERWRMSGIEVRRSAFLALAGLVKSAYWSKPATFRHIGYPGPPRFAGSP